jgi:hypothetical protein
MASGRSGQGVDYQGDPVIDPTANVLGIVQAEARRQDDLRLAESRRVDEQAVLRAEHERDLRLAETARLNAIRTVDVNAAAILAAQSAAQAEALRAQVEATRVAAQLALAAALEPIQKDISDIRRDQYQQQGEKSAGAEQKTSVSDNRALWFGVLGVLGIAVVAISPHIH